MPFQIHLPNERDADDCTVAAVRARLVGPEKYHHIN